MKLFASLIFGILVGISGTFLHNSYHPLGVVVSLFAVWLGSRLVRNMYQSRSTNLLFALGWFLVIVRGSTLGMAEKFLSRQIFTAISLFLGVPVC